MQHDPLEIPAMDRVTPNFVDLAQRMVLATHAFIDALEQLGLPLGRQNHLDVLRAIPEHLANSVQIVLHGAYEAGTSAEVYVPTAELHRWRERLPHHIASQYACSRDDAVLFMSWVDDPTLIPRLSCNHPLCRNTQTLHAVNFTPADARSILQRATTELWYCHVHAGHAIQHEGAVSDQVADILARMQAAPGSSSTHLAIDRVTAKVLLANDLATREAPRRGFGGYKWTITDAGARILRKRGLP